MRKYSAFLALFVSACLVRAADFTTGQAARAVVGQLTFTAQNTTPGKQVVGAVGGLAFANGMLFVADSSPLGATEEDFGLTGEPVTVNNRVLIFLGGDIPTPYTDLSTLGVFDPDNCNVCGYPAYNVLGQPNFTSNSPDYPVPTGQTYGTPTSSNMRAAAGVASDGHILAVADTGNNRVLIWNSIPASTVDAPADVVLGQADFTHATVYSPPTPSSLRAPQGVWIQNGKLYVADTQDSRVLIWNRIPTSNNQPADLVLGQTSFTTANAPPLTAISPNTAANQLWNPTSVTSDGTRLFVADYGFNRVLIWNNIPASMDQPADVVVGQPGMTTSVPNWTTYFCPVSGSDVNGTPCAGTLNFPSYALSDGTRLFIADQGNDRVLIFNSIPTQNGANADVVLGQPNMTTDVISSQTISIASTAIDNTAGVDTIPSPTSLAFDGTNLYVSDPFNLRVLVFTPGDTSLPDNSVVNWASEIIRQEGVITMTGTIVANDTVTVTIGTATYTYTEKSKDTLDDVAQGIVNAINSSNSGAGDPNATAIFAGAGSGSVYLSSKSVDLAYDSIALSATSSNIADVNPVVSGAYLSAGTAATAAPGMLVEIDGSNLTDQSTPVVAPLSGAVPTRLAGAQVFMDGLAAPIFRASNVQIITQVPFNFTDRNSTSIYVRTTHSDGTVTITNATPVYIAPANPGLFATAATPGEAPVLRPAAGAFHQSGNPEAVIDFEGTVTAGNTVTITVNGRNYTYTVQATDTLTSIVQGLVNAINSPGDPQVTASVGGQFNRVVLTAKQGGAAGTGIPVATTNSASATVSGTAYTSATCCDVTPNSAITAANPAVPGETINVSAAGLGILTDPTGTAATSAFAGSPYAGPQPNTAANFVTATMGGTTAEVVSAGFPQGSYGVYQVQLVVPTGATTNANTQLFIAQNAYISNLVTLPVGPAAQTAGGSGNPNSVFTSGVTFTATPNPIPPGANGLGSTTLAWTGAPGNVAIYNGNPTSGGGQIALGFSSGTSVTKNVADGTTFYLQDLTNPNPKSLNATLATLSVHVESGIAIGIDSPSASSSAYSGIAHFGGWALDSIGTVGSVTVSIDGVSVGSAAYGASRPDVCAHHPGAPNCPNVGWDFYYDTTALANGSHAFQVTVQAVGGQRLSQASSFTIRNAFAASGTIAVIDTPNSADGPIQGAILLSGWALNPNSAIASVAILIDGASYGNASYTVSRPDVCAANPGAPGCPIVGWSLLFDTNSLSNGTHTLEAVATANNGDVGAVATTLNVANWTSANPMTLSIGVPNQINVYSGAAVVFGGWALDNDAAIQTVSVSIDGVGHGNAIYGGSRPDVCVGFPDRPGCPNVGWNLVVDTTQLADGRHKIAVTGTTTTGQSSTISSTFTVKNLTTSNALHAYIDFAGNPSTTFSGTASFTGWALADNGAITSVQILVDGVARGSAQYGISRPDVCGGYPSGVGCPNVGWTFSFDTSVLTNGPHILAADATSSTGEHGTVEATFIASNSYAGNPITISIDQPASNASPYEGLAQFSGWAVDLSAAITTVSISIDGVPYGAAQYGVARPDICAVYSTAPGCPNVGWSALVDTTHLTDGVHTLGVTANAANGAFSVVSWVFTVANWSTPDPIRIGIDNPSAQNSGYFGTVNFGGWALDVDTPIASVQVAVDGTPVGIAAYGGSRPDACAKNGNPPGCPNVGWGIDLDTTLFADGDHTLDVTAISATGQRSTSSASFTIIN
ncbi:MAG TPA: hypothetical protein VMF91_05745 [Bryobacteraceae bacterium]|nr:hypothetical protein [Bryobacteraceae bacterium]